MYVREHVEELILNRLARTTPSDLPEWLVEVQFKRLYGSIEIAMNKILWNNSIPEFTDDDLVSFMLLKAHQLIRQDKYDDSKNPYAFFYTAFSNLMKDILRATKRKKCDVMHTDGMEYVLSISVFAE